MEGEGQIVSLREHIKSDQTSCILTFPVLGPHTSSNPCSPHYQGRSASSEIEVRNILEYLNDNRDSLLAFYDLHSFGQYFFYPWAYTSKAASDFAELVSFENAFTELRMKSLMTEQGCTSNCF